MKKVLVLCLVYASLVSAGFFRSKDDVRVDKEGVVIGIEDDNGNTKVKISPQEVDPHEKGVFSNVKEKIKEASSSVLPEVGRTKEAAEKAANEAVEKGYAAEEAVKDRVAQATRTASDKARESREKVSEMKEGFKEKGKAAEERVKAQGKKGVKRVFGYLVSPFSFSSVLHLLGFSTAYGMCVWETFGSNFVLSKALPRQQLAMVQSRVYPVYFKAMAASVGVALVGYMMDKSRLGVFRGFDLMASLLMILANLLYLEPRATKVLFERMRKEKEEGGEADVATGEGKKHEEGGEEEAEAPAGGGKVQNVRNVVLSRLRTNSHSSILNIATLMSLTWHLVNLGQNVRAEC